MAGKTLSDIAPEDVFHAQQAALMQLQLFVVMRTHELLREFGRAARDILGEQFAQGGDGRAPGAWDGLSTHLAIEGITKAWGATCREWRRLLDGAREQAASLPFGTLAVLHAAAFAEARREEETLARTRPPGLLQESDPSPVFRPQLGAILDATANRVYGDGFRLSQRVWNLEQESLDGIRRIVYDGVASGDSAWNVAKKLEPYLGAGAECPRWARSRLYRLTKGDIAGGNRTGLYSGDECAGQGVAYKALRLARNEIQIAHHAATDEMLARVPWIEKERINLSPAHPVTDICDDVIGNGERGEGIYPTGTIQLPLHVQCLCYKTAVLLPPDEFAGRLREWLSGADAWPEMDEYAGFLGVAPAALASIGLGVRVAQTLVLWLWGAEEELEAVFESD